MSTSFYIVCVLVGVVGVWSAPSSQVASAVFVSDDLQEDIDWAMANTTKLASDLNNLHNSELLYYGYLSLITAQDFMTIEELLRAVGVPSAEIDRLNEVLTTYASEIRLLLEQHLIDTDLMQFQCIRILSSLKLDLKRLHAERTKIDSMMSSLMQELSLAKFIINSQFNTLNTTIQDLIVGQSGPEIDEINANLDKIQTDLGVKNSQVKSVADVASSTKSELESILDWIISQIPAHRIIT